MSAHLRDLAETLIYRYTATADRKDVDAVVALLGQASVEFPHAAAKTEAELRNLFGALWEGTHGHRHVVTNVLIEPGPHDHHVATALYSRYSLEPDPILTTLGSYRFEFTERGGEAVVNRLTVVRAWQLGY